MSSVRRLIPHLFTAANLIGGILAIMTAMAGHIYIAPFFILFSVLMDFLDGFMARLLKVPSELGKQLDSLADMVTFGVAPGVIAYILLDIPNGLMHESIIQSTHDAMVGGVFQVSCGPWHLYIGDSYEMVVTNGVTFTGVDLNAVDVGDNLKVMPDYDYNSRYWPSIIALLIPVLALFRLAKFNLDETQKDSFVGLPTPAMALFFVSIPIILFVSSATIFSDALPTLFLLSPYFLIPATIILSVLMVVPLPLFALKFKSFAWKGNEIRYIFLTISVGLLATLFWWALPIIILLYIILSVINNLITKSTIDEIQS